ncbi:unnamed protein product [Protopolystoma xenopodis]|uniref:Uncharacterized protein n=1 Tax=Protopolystoma xenopodis TaxID=117903 RepID=A0A3S5A896_9PLAT|nr:unnamed protein product [Protopolystoma xenopodis]
MVNGDGGDSDDQSFGSGDEPPVIGGASVEENERVLEVSQQEALDTVPHKPFGCTTLHASISQGLPPTSSLSLLSEGFESDSQLFKTKPESSHLNILSAATAASNECEGSVLPEVRSGNSCKDASDMMVLYNIPMAAHFTSTPLSSVASPGIQSLSCCPSLSSNLARTSDRLDARTVSKRIERTGCSSISVPGISEGQGFRRMEILSGREMDDDEDRVEDYRNGEGEETEDEEDEEEDEEEEELGDEEITNVEGEEADDIVNDDYDEDGGINRYKSGDHSSPGLLQTSKRRVTNTNLSNSHTQVMSIQGAKQVDRRPSSVDSASHSPHPVNNILCNKPHPSPLRSQTLSQIWQPPSSLNDFRNSAFCPPPMLERERCPSTGQPSQSSAMVFAGQKAFSTSSPLLEEICRPSPPQCETIAKSAAYSGLAQAICTQQVHANSDYSDLTGALDIPFSQNQSILIQGNQQYAYKNHMYGAQLFLTCPHNMVANSVDLPNELVLAAQPTPQDSLSATPLIHHLTDVQLLDISNQELKAGENGLGAFQANPHSERLPPEEPLGHGLQPNCTSSDESSSVSPPVLLGCGSSAGCPDNASCHGNSLAGGSICTGVGGSVDEFEVEAGSARFNGPYCKRGNLISAPPHSERPNSSPPAHSPVEHPRRGGSNSEQNQNNIGRLIVTQGWITGPSSPHFAVANLEDSPSEGLNATRNKPVLKKDDAVQEFSFDLHAHVGGNTTKKSIDNGTLLPTICSPTAPHSSSSSSSISSPSSSSSTMPSVIANQLFNHSPQSTRESCAITSVLTHNMHRQQQISQQYHYATNHLTRGEPANRVDDYYLYAVSPGWGQAQQYGVESASIDWLESRGNVHVDHAGYGTGPQECRLLREENVDRSSLAQRRDEMTCTYSDIGSTSISSSRMTTRNMIPGSYSSEPEGNTAVVACIELPWQPGKSLYKPVLGSDNDMTAACGMYTPSEADTLEQPLVPASPAQFPLDSWVLQSSS